ncbi:TPA: DUF6630 family protein [Streptococcus suis]|nr:hypothetical protein [Streptococcus suis]NQP31722.1 hypothetical protein [Streptococcus suis]NQP34007.1 hypothetical protein [Streptococcus suis]
MLTEENLQDIFELADLMSNGDRELFITLREVVFATDPNKILDDMERILDPVTFDQFIAKVGESEKENLWLILMTLLENGEYICVQNHKDQLTDFIHYFDRLQHVRLAGISLALDSDGLVPTATIPEWAAVIDRKYGNEGYCLGAVDMNSDSYCLFFNQRAQFERIQELAHNVGYTIKLAKQLS